MGKSAFSLALIVVSGWLILSLGTLGQVIEEEDREASPPAPAGQVKSALERATQQIVERTNRFRREQKHAEVQTDPKLTDAARYFADYLAKTDKFSHTADEKQPGERAKEHGYDYCFVSENIAYEENPAGATTEGLAEKFVEVWKQVRYSRRRPRRMESSDVVIDCMTVVPGGIPAAYVCSVSPRNCSQRRWKRLS